MKTIHLLAVDASAERYAPLISAAAAIGLKVGWLDLESQPEVPPALDAANRCGTYRSVAVSGAVTLAAKAVAGGIRLQDVLREHFLGCRLVLIRGEVPPGASRTPETIPRLVEHPMGWTIGAGPVAIELTSAALAKRLRRPASTFLDS